MLSLSPASSHYKWMVFSVVSLGSLMQVFHHIGINVALPTIAQYFSVSLTTVQWVILGESLTISALLLPMGRLSDIIGRRTIYMLGISLFGVMAFLTGSSPWIATTLGLQSPIMLMIFFKIFQGIGASMSQATGLAMVTSSFPRNERGKGLGAHGSIIGVGAVGGPIIAGLLITYLNWQWFFWMNVPLSGITLIFAFFILNRVESISSTDGETSFDWVGAALSSIVLLTFLLLLSNTGQLGWTHPYVLLGSLLFITTLILFSWWELRFSSPMLDLRLFKDKLLSVGVSTNYFSFFGSTSFTFLIPFYLQAVLKLNPAQVSYALIPNAITRVILGPISGNLSDRYGRKIFATSGLSLCGIGLYMMAFMGISTPLWYVIISIIIFSSGSGIFMSPNNATIFRGSSESKHGVASALVSLSRNAGNITGIAVATAIVAATMYAGGYSTDVESVLTANINSDLLGSFIIGMKIVYFFVGTVQIGSSLAHLVLKNPIEQ